MAFVASSQKCVNEDPEVSFELVGFDFMIDEDLKVYLIEVNKNPCLSTLSEQQGILISRLLRDTFTITFDAFFKLNPKDDKTSTSNTKFELIHSHFMDYP